MRDEKNTLWLIAGGSDGGIKMYDCSQVDTGVDDDCFDDRNSVDKNNSEDWFAREKRPRWNV